MEYLEGGSLRDLLDSRKQPLKEPILARFIQNILQGLKYLHMERRIHRDIKAANVLISKSGVAKLVDFGVSQQLTKTMQKRNTFVGTPYWMAPEVIAASYYDEKADIWSLGITIIELACGKPPWFQVHPMKALFLIMEKDPPVLQGNFSADLKDFVSHCLRKEPDERWDAASLLKHPFLKVAADYSEIMSLIDGIKRPGKPVRKAARSGKNFLKEKVMMKKIETFSWTFGRVLKVSQKDNLVSCTVRLSTGSQREFQLYSKDRKDNATVLKNQEGSLCKLIRNGMTLDSLQFENGTVLRIVSSKLDVDSNNNNNNTVIHYESADTKSPSNTNQTIPSHSSVKSPRRNLLSLFGSGGGHQRSLSDPVSSLESTVVRFPSSSSPMDTKVVKYLSSSRHPFLTDGNNSTVQRKDGENTVVLSHHKTQDENVGTTTIMTSTVKKLPTLETPKDAAESMTSETNNYWNSKARIYDEMSEHTVDTVQQNTVIYRNEQQSVGKKSSIKTTSHDDTMSMDRQWIKKESIDPYLEFASRDYSQTVSETVLPKRFKSLVMDEEELEESLVETYLKESEGDLQQQQKPTTTTNENTCTTTVRDSLTSSSLKDAHPILVKIIIPAIRQLEAEASTLDDNDMKEIKLFSELASIMFQLDEIRPGILFVLFRQVFKQFATCDDQALRSLFYSFSQGTSPFLE